MNAKNNSTSSFKLKIIAIITMFIDHIGAVILEKIEDDPIAFGVSDDALSAVGMVDLLLRATGRIAFPLFIFMIIEGFKYTRSREKYFLRLLAFAIISDIPFDIAMFPEFITGWFPETFIGQNVFFTLAIGLGAITLIDRIRNVNPDIDGAKKLSAGSIKRTIGVAGTTVVALYAAKFVECDYGMSGVLAIIVAYMFKDRYVGEIVAPVVVLGVFNPFEFVALIDAAIIADYKGEKGRSFNKWFFYIFYPAHLLLLAGIRELLKILVN